MNVCMSECVSEWVCGIIFSRGTVNRWLGGIAVQVKYTSYGNYLIAASKVNLTRWQKKSKQPYTKRPCAGHLVSPTFPLFFFFSIKLLIHTMALRLLSARVMRPYAPVLRQSANLAAFRTYASKCFKEYVFI